MNIYLLINDKTFNAECQPADSLLDVLRRYQEGQT